MLPRCQNSKYNKNKTQLKNTTIPESKLKNINKVAQKNPKLYKSLLGFFQYNADNNKIIETPNVRIGQYCK